MSHRSHCGEGLRFDGRPCVDRRGHPNPSSDEPDQDLHTETTRRDRGHHRRGLKMALSTEHKTHLHHIFYGLCSSRKWALGLPTRFDYGYLDSGLQKVQARIILRGQRKPMILIHPAAFARCKGHLVAGLLHHELCHFLLGPDVGHGPQFSYMEEGWSGYFLFKQESADFARWLARQSPKWTLSCVTCNAKFVRNTVPKGRIACRRCCEEHANGEYDERYTLHIGGAVMSTS